MKRFYTQHSELIILFLAIFALVKIAPGFRPRELKQFLFFLTQERGISLLFSILFYSIASYIGFWIKNKLRLELITTGIFLFFSFLFCVDIFADRLMGKSFSIWCLRILYCFLFGFLIFKNKKIFSIKKFFNKDKVSRSLEVLFPLVLFFLFRENLHYFMHRSPEPFGDEISWWQTGAKEIMNLGLIKGIQVHWYGNYTPAIPWLISLPERFIGIHREVWLFSYAPIIMLLYILFIYEISKTRLGKIAGITLLFFTLTMNRDFHNLFAGSLYGESISGLLLAICTYEFIYLKNKKLITWISMSFLIGFIRLTKPPVSMLSFWCFIFLAMIFTAKQLKKRNKIDLKSVTLAILGLLIGTGLGFKLWIRVLGEVGKTQEYTVFVSDIFKNGINIAIPLGMLSGLANFGTPQFAFTLGTIMALVFALIQKKYLLFKTQISILIIYWGFVFGLYATFWQKGDFSSAGRYLSHAAFACILLVPMAFDKKTLFAGKDEEPISSRSGHIDVL